jgi:RND family efflux transporter MFP subunit
MVLAVMAWSVGVSGQPPAKVRLDGARLESVEQMRRVTGELRALRRSELATQESGLVLGLEVREGDSVEAGAVVARLDDERQRLELARLQAELEALQASVAEREAERSRAETELERVRSLRERNSASVQELEDAELDAVSASARLTRAKADVAAAARAVDLAATSLRDMTVTAPFAARVVRVMTEQGQWLATGDPVVELYATESIEAWIDVPERYIGRIAGAEGTLPPRVNIAIEAIGSTLEGEIIQIIPDADPLSRLFPVRIRVTDGFGLLRPGMSVVAEVPTGTQAQTLTVHKDAILRNDAGEFVYMAIPNPMAPGPEGGMVGAPVQVDRIFAVADRVAIRPGPVAPGAQLVVEGNERMFPMQPLEIQVESAPTTAEAGAASDGEG